MPAISCLYKIKIVNIPTHFQGKQNPESGVTVSPDRKPEKHKAPKNFREHI